MQPLTQNYFCWGVCYGPQDAGAIPAWSSLPQHSITMSPGVGYSNFGGYHSPMGQVGSSTYRFVWYDVGNPTDTVWVDIEFEANSVGIHEAATAQLGAAVLSETIRATQQTTLIATELSPGVYFATLENNEALLATQRFVVTGR